jgi:hypothetical protein
MGAMGHRNACPDPARGEAHGARRPLVKGAPPDAQDAAEQTRRERNQGECRARDTAHRAQHSETEDERSTRSSDLAGTQAGEHAAAIPRAEAVRRL